MAKYEWTGAGETVGNAPSLFNALWDGSINDWEVKTDSEAQLEGKVLEFKGTGSARRGLNLTAAGSSITGRVDIRGRFWRQAAGTIHFARARQSGAPGAANCVYAGANATGQWTIAAYINNAYDPLDPDYVGAPPQGWYRFRFVVAADNSSTLTVWPDTDAESTAVTLTDNAVTLPAGGVGIGSYSDKTAKLDWVTFGTGGDDADDYPLGSNSNTPSLTSPTGSVTPAGVFSGSVNTDTNSGVISYVISTRAAKPSGTEVVAGKDSSGSASAFSGTVNISSAGAKSISKSGLQADVLYYLHAVHTANSERSVVVTSQSFSYASPPAVIPVPTNLSTSQVTETSAVLTWDRGL